MAELDTRLGVLFGILDGIQGKLDAYQAQADRAKQAESLAADASARADDALSRVVRVEALNERVDALAVAVAHGIEHVERTEARIRATVQRARKELADSDYGSHPGLEAEAQQLRLIDGGGSEEGRVPPVREDVEESQQALLVQLRNMGLSG